MEKTERVLLYDGLVNIGILEKMFNRDIIFGLEQIYSYELENSRDILKSFGLTWLLNKNITCYIIYITEEELEVLDDWYGVPLLSKRTLIIGLSTLCWIYYVNNQDLKLGESNLIISNKKQLIDILKNFIKKRKNIL